MILLDLELPKMDGLTFLKRIMAQRPLPVVVCSSHTEAGSRAMFAALDAGAVEVLAKPRLDSIEAREEAAERLGQALRAAAASRRPDRRRANNRLDPGKKLTADAILPPLPPRAVPPTMPVVAIGASTGGTQAIQRVLAALAPTAPAIVIVQHMPEGFTAAFSRRLNMICDIEVQEASDGDTLRPGLVLIAPGNHHTVLRRSGAGYRVGVLDGPSVSRHRPSVDVLFRSTAQQAGANALGVIMTGMGDDGAAGMLEMRLAGARTLAQDESSCVVYGMPREAVERDAVMRTLDIDQIAPEILGWHGQHQTRGASA